MIYLSYKQSWIPTEILEKELNYIKNQINKLWEKIFIYYFDSNSNLPPKQLLKNFLLNIKKSNIVLAYINYPNKSEWQLLELGMAYCLWKKIKILINKEVKENYYLVYGLWEVIEFKNLEEVDFKKLIKQN